MLVILTETNKIVLVKLIVLEFFSIRKAMNYKYYNTSSATEIRINAQRMIRSGSWYEQEVINFWFNVDNIFMAYRKKTFFPCFVAIQNFSRTLQ